MLASVISKESLVIKQRVKYFVGIILGLLGISLFSSLVVYGYTHLPPPRSDDADPAIFIQSMLHAGDPVMLYQTIGIKECGQDALYKIEQTRAAILESDDLLLVKPFLEFRFTESVSAVLYVNTPESSVVHGKPALIALREEGSGLCVLGKAESWSPKLFSMLETKYQPKLSQK